MSDTLNSTIAHWIKYDRKPIDLSTYTPRKQTPVREDGYRSDYEKPRGTWITDDTDANWPAWCRAENFDLHRLSHKHQVAVDMTRVLVLTSAYALDEFTDKYSGLCHWGDKVRFTNRYIDWHRVCDEYDGLIITPYQWERRMELSWYYTWDCASGCIWNVSAIKEIKLLSVEPTLIVEAAA